MNQGQKNQNQCQICHQSFNSERELQDHKMNAHGQQQGQQQHGQQQHGQQQQGQRQPDSMKNEREKKTA